MLSCPDLSSFFYVSILDWSGCELGWAFYVLFCVFGLVWFPIRGSCQSLSLIENHTQSACFPTIGCGQLFSVLCVFTLQNCFVSFTLSLCCFLVILVCSLFVKINMDTYHAAFWSNPSYSSSEEDTIVTHAISTDKHWQQISLAEELSDFKRGTNVPSKLHMCWTAMQKKYQLAQRSTRLNFTQFRDLFRTQSTFPFTVEIMIESTQYQSLSM